MKPFSHWPRTKCSPLVIHSLKQLEPVSKIWESRISLKLVIFKRIYFCMPDYHNQLGSTVEQETTGTRILNRNRKSPEVEFTSGQPEVANRKFEAEFFYRKWSKLTGIRGFNRKYVHF